MRKVLVVEGVAEPTVEDGGQALILEVSDDADAERGEFVRLQSWCERCDTHPVLGPLAGKRLRVTVEIVDELA